MNHIVEIALYCFAFLSIYVQVFFLVTFLEGRKKVMYRNGAPDLDEYPNVTVVVPCWNEENTIARTVNSLLDLEYPADKLEIFLVDDGSTDRTWETMQKYAENTRIKIFHKENGGKHTAMNYGIENSTSPFISCLDADSFVDKYAISRMMGYFKDPTVMSVSPSIVVDNPKTIIQHAQKAEYQWAVFVKKMLAIVGGIHVTPGPFSIYRREIFEKIGMFRKAHNTEDMEIAYRMQKNHMKIEQCNDAFVYTVSPDTVAKLYKQRLRWIHGFIKNTYDYRSILFQKKYGTFSIFTVPSGIISVVSATFLFMYSTYHFFQALYIKALSLWTVGFQPSNFRFHFNFDWFFISASLPKFLLFVLYTLLVVAIVIGHKMVERKFRLTWNIIPFMVIYSVLAPFWLLNAMYKAVVGGGVKWR